MTFPQPFFHPSGVTPLTITFMDNLSGGSQTATETWSAANIGAAPAAGKRRFVVVMIGHHNFTSSTTITGVTIGGITASEALNFWPLDPQDSIGRLTFAIHWAEVPTGTTADVVWTWSASGNRNNVMRFCYVIESGPGGIELIDTNESISLNTASYNVDLTVVENGVALAGTGANNCNGHTWTGLTEDLDTDANSTDYHSSASAQTVANTTLTINCVDSPSGGTLLAPLAGSASFGPL